MSPSTSGTPRLRRLRRVLLTLVVGTAALLAGGCEKAPSILQPRAQGAQDILNLAYILLGIAAAIFLVVEIWLIVNIIRFRRRDEDEVDQTHGNVRLELVYTIIPILIVIVIFIFTVQTMDTLEATGTGLPIKVTGNQWWWQIEYPESGFVTANEFYVPVETDVHAELHSKDVIHSFWMPQIGGKTDMIPGRTNQAAFTVTSPGEYLGECGEFCGVQHAHMRFLMFAVSKEEFSSWVELQQQPAAEPGSEAARRGQQVFLQAACAGCHTIRGTQAAGQVGPDLTHFGGRKTLAAYTTLNTPDNLRHWVDKPQEVKPGNQMPEVPLDEQQLNDVVAYLEGLK